MFRKFKQITNNKDFLKSLLPLLSGAGISQLLPFVLAPVIARLYTPEQMGVLAVYMAFVGVLAVFSTGKYSMAIVLVSRRKRAQDVFWLSTLWCIVFSVLVLIAIFFFKEGVADALGNNHIEYWLWYAPLSVFAEGMYQNFNFWFTREEKFNKIGRSKWGQALGQNSSRFGLGVLQFGSSGLILSYILGQILALFYFVIHFFKAGNGEISRIRLKDLKYVAVRFKKFPLFSMPSGGVNVLSAQSPVFILSNFFCSSLVGIFSYAIRLVHVPISVLGASVAQVYYQKVRVIYTEKNKVRELSISLIRKLSFLLGVPLLVVAVWGGDVFAFVLGAKWAQSGEFAAYLVPWFFLILIGSPLSMLFDVYEKQDVELYFNILGLILRVSALLVGSVFFSIKETILFFALAGSVFWLSTISYLFGLIGLKKTTLIWLFFICGIYFLMIIFLK